MAVHHDERSSRDRTRVAPVAPRGQTQSRRVAEKTAPLLEQLFDREAPVRIVFWDGSAVGPAEVLEKARGIGMAAQ